MVKQFKCSCKGGEGSHSSKGAVLKCKRSRDSSYGTQIVTHKEEYIEPLENPIQNTLKTRNNAYEMKPLTPAQYSEMRHFMTDTLSENPYLNMLHAAKSKLDEAVTENKDKFIVKELENNIEETINTIRYYIEVSLLSDGIRKEVDESNFGIALKNLLERNEFTPDFHKVEQTLRLYDEYVRLEYENLGTPLSFEGKYKELEAIIMPLKSRTLNAKMSLMSNIANILIQKEPHLAYEAFEPIFVQYSIDLYIAHITETQQFASEEDKTGRLEVARYIMNRSAPNLLRAVFNRFVSYKRLADLIAFQMHSFPEIAVQMVLLAEVFRQAKARPGFKTSTEPILEYTKEIFTPLVMEPEELRPITEEEREEIRRWEKEHAPMKILDIERQKESARMERLEKIERAINMDYAFNAPFQFEEKLAQGNPEWIEKIEKKKAILLEAHRPLPIYSSFRKWASEKISPMEKEEEEARLLKLVTPRFYKK